MLRKFTRRGTHAFSGGFQALQVLFESSMDTFRADRFRSGRPVRLPLGSLERSSNQVSRQS